jgi:uncharacterized protein (TIGR02246 family)
MDDEAQDRSATPLFTLVPSPYGALRLVGVLLLTVCLAACQPGEDRGRQTGATVDTAAVKSALDSIRQTFIAAYEAGDAEQIASLWTEQGRQAIPMAPPVRGRDTIEALSKRWFESNPATREATLDTVRDVRVLSEDWAYAYTTWTFRVTPEDADQPQTTTATFVMLYRKTPDGWKTHLEVGSPHSAPGE